jgi:hypothetical protein
VPFAVQDRTPALTWGLGVETVEEVLIEVGCLPTVQDGKAHFK